MIAQIITENGQKKIIPLTADTGAGNPVGSLISMYKKSSPSGYLYCDGSTFDQTKYPALYQYLGSNVLPDYRECVAVGAEQNTTDTIATHDVYTEGQFKDDQLQDHTHKVAKAWTQPIEPTVAVSVPLYSRDMVAYETPTQEIADGRHGATTRGKRKAVFVYIKATSGLTENQQENVLNTINENLSYSTTEHKTGKKWIDGKMIYERVIMCSTALTFTPNQWTSLVSYFSGMTDLMAVIDTLINAKIEAAKDTNISNAFVSVINSSAAQAKTAGDYTITATGGYISVEYTKTV